MTALLNFYGCWLSLALMLVWGVRETLIRNDLAQAEQLRAENERLDADNEGLEKENQRLIEAMTQARFDLWWLEENAETARPERVKRHIHLAYDRINALLKAPELQAGDA